MAQYGWGSGARYQVLGARIWDLGVKCMGAGWMQRQKRTVDRVDSNGSMRQSASSSLTRASITLTQHDALSTAHRRLQPAAVTADCRFAKLPIEADHQHSDQGGNRAAQVGVGIRVAPDPLHGSGRADFPHPALASGDNAHAAKGIIVVAAHRR